MKQLHILATDTSLTIWWHKPEQAPGFYEIFLNGEPVTTTDKTHYTIQDLAPDTEYTIEVGGLAAQAHTRPAFERIDVTAAPYHAKGDGVMMNTAVLQQAINDCTAGQCVYLPRGVYMTGALRLHSHMAIFLEEGAVLQGTDVIADYEPRIPSRFEGTEMMCYSSLLNMGELNHQAGPNCEDVLIYGHGTIASGGRPLAQRIVDDERIRLRDELVAMGDKILEYENQNTIPGRVRPRLINMSNCSNVRITGLTLADGASWNVHMIYSDHITTDHCTFRSENVWNGDGWDPDSSEDCTIFACDFYTGDDAVAIKSGKNPEGNAINRATRRIRVFDCTSYFGHGVTIGSEMSGGVEDVQVWDCALGSSVFGLEIKGTQKRGGYVRNIHMRDCTVSRIMMHAVGYNDDGIGAPMPPKFSDCSFTNVTMTGKYIGRDRTENICAAIELIGFDVPGYEVSNVSFKNCNVPEGTPLKIAHCQNVQLDLN